MSQLRYVVKDTLCDVRSLCIVMRVLRISGFWFYYVCLLILLSATSLPLAHAYFLDGSALVDLFSLVLRW